MADVSGVQSRGCGLPEKGDEGGVRTHASEEIAALTQRLRPLGHLATASAGSESDLELVRRCGQSVQPLGFEPRTFAVLKRRHNQLDHGCVNTVTHGNSVQIAGFENACSA